MNNIRKGLLSLVAGFSWLALSHGQSAIPAAGGNASGTGGTVSYSIGQVTYHTYSDENKSVAQGVQQPYEISVVTATENTEGITLEYKIYPNPAKEFIILTIAPFNDENFKYRLYDLSGILILEKKIMAGMTEIPVDSFTPSMYFLRIFKDNLEVKLFKIIKN
jgi:Secretion system C-terminal sorting domain